MAYLVLARKYRPQTFEQVIGQDHVTRTLANAISAGRMAHAILFSGPRGTGKTTIARILAKAMNCSEGPSKIPCNTCRSCREITSGNAADVFEIDGASNNSVDQVRDLRENVKYMPQHSPYKIYIIDEVHMLSIAAFNALLKTLEEPPAHVMFFFATTEPHKIPVTILSRCQRHDLKRIDLETIKDHMVSLCAREGLQIAEESLNLIAREAGGCMRDALSLLDQVLACSKDTVNPEIVPDILGVTDRKNIFEISTAILERDIPRFLDILGNVYEHGQDLKKLYAELIEHFRNLLVLKIDPKGARLINTPGHEIELMREQIKETPETYLNQVLDILFREESTIRFSSQPRLALEITGIKIIQIRPAVPIETLIKKLDLLRNEFAGKEPERSTESDGRQFKISEKTNPETPLDDNTVTGATKKALSNNSKTLSEDKKGEWEKAEIPENHSTDLKQLWQELRSKICRQIPSMASPLSNCELTRLTDQEVFIKITDSKFNINLLNRKKDSLIKVCCDFFRKKMNLVMETTINRENDHKNKINQSNSLKEEAVRHPLVADAIEIFNGNVVDVKLL
jgi:DNA polymerase-3 subunit gamma/tau